MNNKLLLLLLASIDLTKLSSGLLDEVLEPALQKVVDDTTNPFDNAAMAMLYPTLEAELKKLIAAKIAELVAHTQPTAAPVV
jgi:hypothetical protein